MAVDVRPRHQHDPLPLQHPAQRRRLAAHRDHDERRRRRREHRDGIGRASRRRVEDPHGHARHHRRPPDELPRRRRDRLGDHAHHGLEPAHHDHALGLHRPLLLPRPVLRRRGRRLRRLRHRAHVRAGRGTGGIGADGHGSRRRHPRGSHGGRHGARSARDHARPLQRRLRPSGPRRVGRRRPVVLRPARNLRRERHRRWPGGDRHGHRVSSRTRSRSTSAATPEHSTAGHPAPCTASTARTSPPTTCSRASTCAPSRRRRRTARSIRAPTHSRW